MNKTYSNILVKNFIIMENLINVLVYLHKYYFESFVSIAIFSDVISVIPSNIFLLKHIFDSKNFVLRIVSYNRK